MTPTEKVQFIDNELYHELCSLLEAATVWQIFKNSGAGCEVSLVMESALMHARNLFIFFAPTDEDKKNHNTLKMTDFGPKATYKSRLYSVNKEAMNRHLFHLDRNRLKPTNLKNSGHINEKVRIFADEVLRLWEIFESEAALGELKDNAKRARSRAIQDARRTAEGRIEPLFSTQDPS